MVEAAKELVSPYEILELADCQSITLRPVRYETGRFTFHPKWMRPGEVKTVLAIRIHVPTEDKPIFPHYWDITASTLVPQVMALLTAGVPEGYGIKVHAVGTAPKKRFEVSLVSV